MKNIIKLIALGIIIYNITAVFTCVAMTERERIQTTDLLKSWVDGRIYIDQQNQIIFPRYARWDANFAWENDLPRRDGELLTWDSHCRDWQNPHVEDPDRALNKLYQAYTIVEKTRLEGKLVPVEDQYNYRISPSEKMIEYAMINFYNFCEAKDILASMPKALRIRQALNTALKDHDLKTLSEIFHNHQKRREAFPTRFDLLGALADSY